jgi:hypothetical protein
MWDSRCVTTLYLVPDRKEEIVVRKITEKVSDKPDDQELYHDEILAWVPEGTRAKDLNLMTAAPELFKALKEVMKDLRAAHIAGSYQIPRATAEMAYKALAKANRRKYEN